MRNLPVSIVLAVACLLVEGTGTRLAADHEVDVYSIGILSSDTSCPAATHSLRTCPESPTEVYLAFEAQRGRTNNFEGTYVIASGQLDRVSCAPLSLVHVVRIARSPTIPFCIPQS